MSQARDEPSALEAAAEAAGAGDFSSAERHLTGAVERQEASFGPMHSGLAHLLNNLGVVYEHLDEPARAENCYRRAHAIATASFAPDDPAVVVSAKNLRDFCSGRGIPFEQPATPPPTPAVPRVTAAPVAPAPARVSDQVPARPAPAEAAAAPQPAGPTIAWRGLAIVGLIVFGVIVGAIVIAMRSRSTTNEPTAPAPAASAPAHGPASASATPAPSASGPSPDRQPAPRSRPPGTSVASSAATPTVVSARLCRGIETGGEWRCTPVTGALPPGPVFFYTRLKCPTDSRVEHRWYRANRLQQTTGLDIRANEGTGYRTYSRATVGVDRTGEWRVELRAMDGTVLHEERFTVGSP